MPVREAISTPEAPIGPQNPEFSVLLGSVALPPVVQIFGTANSINQYVTERVGADGMEYMPGNLNVLRWQIARRAKAIEVSSDILDGQATEPTEFDQTLQRLVQAGHSTFIKGGRWSPKELFFRAIYQRWDKSLLTLKAAQSVIRRKLSVVLYGESGYGDDYVDVTEFKERTMQPKASVWEAWKLTKDSSVDEIRKAMKDHGIDTFTWDTAHGEDFGEGPQDRLDMLEKLLQAGLVRRFHLSVGRSDQKKRLKKQGKEAFDRQTDKARDAFIESPEKALETTEGQQLAMYIRYMHKEGLPGVVVLEEMPQLWADKAQLAQRQIIANIRRLRNNVLGLQPQ